jgi:hypothetical protein
MARSQPGKTNITTAGVPVKVEKGGSSDEEAAALKSANLDLDFVLGVPLHRDPTVKWSSICPINSVNTYVNIDDH